MEKLLSFEKMRTRVNSLARSMPFGNPLQNIPASRLLVCSTLLAATLIPCRLHAQGGEAAAIPIGDARLIPEVAVEYTTTDNVFLEEEDLVSSYGVVVKPEVSLTADKRLSKVQLFYSGEYASFDESQIDYTDHNLGIDGSQGISKRLRLDARLRLRYGHQELGTGATIGNARDFSEQPSFRSVAAGGGLTYGAIDAKGNLRVGIRLTNRESTNPEGNTRVNNLSNLTPSAEFSLRVSADTRMFVRFEYSDLDYDQGISSDRETLSAFAGVDLAATGKLSGTVQVGLSDVDYTDPQIRDSEELVLRGSLGYRPVDYTEFNLRFSRDFDIDLDTVDLETVDDNTDSDVITDRANLDWRHEWSSRLYHEAGIGYVNVDRECTEGNSYATVEGSFYLNLFLKRWLILGAGILGDQRSDSCDISTRNIDYERQRAVVRLRATL